MCTPSRAAIFTGLHPVYSGLHHFVILSSQPTGLPLNVPTLPQELKKRFGYRTHLVGKWHLVCRVTYYYKTLCLLHLFIFREYTTNPYIHFVSFLFDFFEFFIVKN